MICLFMRNWILMIEGFLKSLQAAKRLFLITLSKHHLNFRGVITSISKNAKYDKKEETYSLIKEDKHVISELVGEFTNNIKFDNKIYWQYGQDDYPKFKRMAFTLPSDSTLREDLYWLKKSEEDLSQVYKIRLEEIQRNDKKLREVYYGEAPNNSNNIEVNLKENKKKK